MLDVLQARLGPIDKTVDSDRDGIPDYLDWDDDNDGIPDYLGTTDSITSLTDTRVLIKSVIKGSPYSITECRVLELIPVLGSELAGGVCHNPGGRLPLLSARPIVTPATLKRAATNFAAW